jgi:dissimilatory sulfite reductase (desulfoviridin) alpha/beta subunit
MQDEKECRRAPEVAAGDLKAGGFIPQRQAGKVTIRCKAPGGRLTSERLQRIAEVAHTYGKGVVHLSVRMSPEIPYVDLSDLDVVVRELADAGQEIASCGKRFRVSTACAGCEYNPNGLTDTQGLAQAATQRFFGQDAPHKFKTCFGGCVRDCVRSRMADLGFQGMVRPRLVADNCTHCGLCAKACQDDALTVAEGGLPVVDAARCIACGDCIKVCPFDAMVVGEVGHGVFAGGKHGKHPHVAYPVAEFVPDEQVMAVIEVTMNWYRDHGRRGERLGDVLDRAGIDSYRRALRTVVGERLLTAGQVGQPKWTRIFYPGLAGTFPTYADIQEEQQR